MTGKWMMKLTNLSITKRRSNWCWLYRLLIIAGAGSQLGLAFDQDSIAEPELKIGIVQRFGSNPSDRLTLTSILRDKLRLKFIDAQQQVRELTTDRVELKVVAANIATLTSEKLIIDNYPNFETAQNTVETLAKQGIELEVAQPDRWQVWARRDIYNTPIGRRKLLTKLQQLGQKNAYIDTKVLRQEHRLVWMVNDREYSGTNLEITTDTHTVGVRSQSGANSERATYPGRLNFQPNAYGTYTLVNHVPLETYLRGVVPHEISATAPDRANAAQAILARTYALQNRHRFAIDNYHLCGDAHCQIYRGATGTNATADRAIAETRNRVLTYQGQLIDALYSSTAGGVTASFTEIWNGTERPYLRPTIDSTRSVWNITAAPLNNETNFRRFIAQTQGFNESNGAVFRWSKQSTLPDMTSFLNRYLARTRHPIGKIARIDEIKILERGMSGRATKLAISTDRGTIALFKDDIRSAFAAPISTLFYLDPLYDSNRRPIGYRFVGGGLGHGVGLSQVGAIALARQGKTAAEILSFYYPNTQLQNYGFDRRS
jgi:SpoIID/LytB domain protein